MIAAYVWWKAKHLVREARPARKLVTLSLIDQELVCRKFRTIQIDDNVWSFFERLDICGELAILVSFRLEYEHYSTLHFIKCLRVEFLTLASHPHFDVEYMKSKRDCWIHQKNKSQELSCQCRCGRTRR